MWNSWMGGDGFAWGGGMIRVGLLSILLVGIRVVLRRNVPPGSGRGNGKRSSMLHFLRAGSGCTGLRRLGIGQRSLVGAPRCLEAWTGSAGRRTEPLALVRGELHLLRASDQRAGHQSMTPAVPPARAADQLERGQPRDAGGGSGPGLLARGEAAAVIAGHGPIPGSWRLEREILYDSNFLYITDGARRGPSHSGLRPSVGRCGCVDAARDDGDLVPRSHGLMTHVFAFLRAYNRRSKLHPSLRLASGVSGWR